MGVRMKNSQAGFTLLELMLSLSIGLVVLSGMISTFSLQQKIFNSQEQKTEAFQTVRAAMNMMSQEVMMAGYRPDTLNNLQQHDDTLSTFTGIVFDPTRTELEIRADINGSGNIVADDSGADPDDWNYDQNERIVYKKIGNQIKRKTSGGYFQPFAENVKTFNFDYLKADGTVALRTGEIRNVQITIEVKTVQQKIWNARKSSKLETMVNLRNMGLDLK